MYIVHGGAGFIGSNIVKALLKKNVEVLVAEDLSLISRNFRNIAALDVDVIDEKIAAKFIETSNKVQGVFVEGAIVDTKSEDSRRMLDVNVLAATQVIDAAARKEIPAVYASSAAVYGRTNKPCKEGENEDPLNIYGYSKLLLDRRIRRAPAIIRKRTAGLRYFNVYGPGEDYKGDMQSIVYRLYQQARMSGKFGLFGGTTNSARDFISVHDVVAFNLEVMERLLRGEELPLIMNVGTGKAMTFQRVCTVINEAMDLPRIPIGTIPFPDELLGKYQHFTEADMSLSKDFSCVQDMPDPEKRMTQVVREWRRR
jgi:ADP-L-glycero-D-manno-heptose 6-epimerase